MTAAGGLFSVDLLWSPANNYVYKTSLYNHLADSYIKNNELEAAETILDTILSMLDQQNEEAFIQLSNLYKQNEKMDKFINIQADYYDLILYDDIKRLKVEEELIQSIDLRWINSFPQEQDYFTDLNDNLILIGRCENDYGCRLSAFRKNSPVKVWENNIKIESCMGLSAIDNSLLFIGKQFDYNHAETYSLYNYYINSGDKKWSTLLQDASLSINVDKIYGYKSLYIIDYYAENNRYLSAVDVNTGTMAWRFELDYDRLLRMKNIELINYDSLIIVPLAEHLLAVNLFSGKKIWEYEFDDFEYIEYVNQNSLFENTLHFISEDDEYFVLDLEQQENIFHEEIYFENKLFIGYLDEQYMLGYMPSGEIYVYKKNVSDIALLWSHNYNYDINLLKVANNTIYIEDIENNKILSTNLIDGKQQQESYVVWKPDQIITSNNTYSCISENKLYVINH